jgi:hypothetical protein
MNLFLNSIENVLDRMNPDGGDDMFEDDEARVHYQQGILALKFNESCLLLMDASVGSVCSLYWYNTPNYTFNTLDWKLGRVSSLCSLLLLCLPNPLYVNNDLQFGVEGKKIGCRFAGWVRARDYKGEGRR